MIYRGSHSRFATALKVTQLLTASILVFAQPAYAVEQLANTGNSSETTNSTNVTISRTSSVSQGNSSSTTNTITQKANTGDNTVSDNAGNVEVSTGDISASSNISNDAGTNIMSIAKSNDSLDFAAQNSQNGNNSENLITIANNQEVLVNQSNTTTLHNWVSSDLNTGGNSMSNNSGSVYVKTGAIEDKTYLSNVGGINQLALPLSEDASYIVINEKNGRDSKNNIIVNAGSQFTITQQNLSSVDNTVNKKHNTGDNKCFNNKDCYIVTGDINSSVAVNNQIGTNITQSIPTPTPVEGEKPSNPEKPNEETSQQKPTNPIQQVTEQIIAAVSGPIADSGKVNGARVLPSTGVGSSSWPLWLNAMIGFGSIAAGLYLRNRFDKDESEVKQIG